MYLMTTNLYHFFPTSSEKQKKFRKSAKKCSDREENHIPACSSVSWRMIVVAPKVMMAPS